MPIVSSEAINDPNLQWFREARFGMFVHFGIYALLERGEWVQYQENIPRREYEQLMHKFNPYKFDADAWVDLAEEAGCKYITLTAKHHDGFCLFDSKLTDYKISNTPFGRDLTGELIETCHQRGMRICLYYSQPDWHHPNFVHLPGAFKDLDDPPPDQQPDWPKYIDYSHGQVEELCTRYGRIDGIWFDGSHKSEKTWHGRELYELIKRHQPSAVVNDRARYGDFFTPERSLPEDLTGYMFEACQSVSQKGWGYLQGAPQFSIPNLLENLVRVAAKGGNFLLNVGPKPDGTIPDCQVKRMKAVGQWLKVHGEPIYNTEAGKILTGSRDILTTRKGNRVYIFLCRWPDTDRLVIPGIRSEPAEAQLLAGRQSLKTRRCDDGLEITDLPMLGPDASINVIRLRFDTEPNLTAEKPPIEKHEDILLRDDGKTVLSVSQAVAEGFGVKGSRLRVVEKHGMHVIINWMASEQRLKWSVCTLRPGQYRARIQLSCPEQYCGSTYVLEHESGSISGVVKPTGSFNTFCWQTIGSIQLPEGTSQLTLYPTEMPYGYIFAHVAAIDLQPV